MQSMFEALKHWASIRPNRPMAHDGDLTLTYAEVLERARRFAGGLRRTGLQKGDRVAVLALNHHRWLELTYGAAAGGFILVPINFRLAPAEMAQQLDDSGCRVLVYDLEFAGAVDALRSSVKTVQHFVCTSGPRAQGKTMTYDALLDAGPWEVAVEETDTFAIYYTGGTTGQAKGVVLSHKAILTNAFQSALDSEIPGNNQVFLHVAPIFHVASSSWAHIITLLGGAHVALTAFDPVAFFRCVERHRVTVTVLVPTMINALINHPDVKKYDLTSLRRIAYGAAPISPDLLEKAIGVFGCEFNQGYGMTEMGPAVALLRAEDHRLDPAKPERRDRLRSAGQAILGVEVRVVDVDGKDVAPGGVGEIWARGDNVMTGYWNKPVETAEVLDRDGWYHTRDLAQIDEEGYLYIVDRAKDMIISGGENVYSVEVENALGSHPAVLEVCVIGIPDERWGEAVKGCVVLKPGATATEAELIAYAKTRIAAYKCPKSLDFVDALPKSAVGKLLKRELRAKYWKGQSRGVA
jgi:long-chain acyl-CoA synthetase